MRHLQLSHHRNSAGQTLSERTGLPCLFVYSFICYYVGRYMLYMGWEEGVKFMQCLITTDVWCTCLSTCPLSFMALWSLSTFVLWRYGVSIIEFMNLTYNRSRNLGFLSVCRNRISLVYLGGPFSLYAGSRQPVA